MNGLQLQTAIFKTIRGLYKDNSEMISDVARLLSVSDNAVYKRIKGMTSINLDDLIKLTSHYKIPLDAHLISESDAVTFSYPPIQALPGSYVEYLDKMLQLTRLSREASPAQLTLQYATNELPFFHYFYFDTLNFFKYFVWAWTNWELDDLKDQKISLEHPLIKGDAYPAVTDEIAELFARINGSEFICVNAIYNTIEQIKYFLQIDKFEKKADALLLCTTLRKLIQHLEKMAQTGKKFKPGEEASPDSPDYFLYHNEMIQTNNVAIYQTPFGNWVFSTFGNPNVLSTNDQRLGEHTINWFEKLKRRSFSLSKSNEKQRISFFHKLYVQLDKAEEEIAFLIGR